MDWQTYEFIGRWTVKIGCFCASGFALGLFAWLGFNCGKWQSFLNKFKQKEEENDWDVEENQQPANSFIGPQ